jgi:hypothetical protein
MGITILALMDTYQASGEIHRVIPAFHCVGRVSHTSDASIGKYHRHEGVEPLHCHLDVLRIQFDADKIFGLL